MDVQQVTFQHLAKTLDIKSPSLYNHFKNMRDVKTALTAKFLQELKRPVASCFGGKKRSGSTAIYAQIYQSFAFSNQAVYELLISVPHTNEADFIRRNL